jgi:hypothetical protein
MDILKKNELKDVFAEIEGYENKLRRYNAFKELDIYNQNQSKYILEKIRKMYGEEAACSIQAETSINLATRIVNAESSIYKRPALRTFSGTEKEIEQANSHYNYMNADEKLKTANRLFRLGNQCAIQVIPKNGKLKTRVLYKHQYDVVPLENDPESAFMYIIPMQAKSLEVQEMYSRGDGMNQKIADLNDSDLSKNRYIVWTSKYNFMADGNGSIIDPLTGQLRSLGNENEILNPIQTLPFVDISGDKLMGFWSSYGSSLTDFSISFGCTLSDIGEIVKLQGYSQAVISSLEEPKAISVGPHRALWMKKDKNEPGDKDPTFQFVSPSPDLQGSLKFVEDKLKIFLTSRGTDSNTVSTGQSKDYASGLERLLAMVDRAEATAEDKVLFQRVEQEYFNLIKKWNVHIQNAQDVQPEANISQMPMSMEMTVKFDQPIEIQTKEQKETSAMRRIEMGLLSRKMAAMEIYEISEDQAETMLEEIDSTEFSPIGGDENKAEGSSEESSEQGGVDVAKNNQDALNVQKLALNGAQVSSLIEIVQSVATGNLPRESGVAMIESAFNFDRQTAENIMNKSGKGFKPSLNSIPSSGSNG